MGAKGGYDADRRMWMEFEHEHEHEIIDVEKYRRECRIECLAVR